MISNDAALLPKWMWLLIPIGWLIFQLVLEWLLSWPLIIAFHGEGSVHETIQFLLLCTSLGLLIILFKFSLKRKTFWLSAFFFLIMLATFYTAAEEVSYGQSFFDWQTPDKWKNINKQQETNLHNTSRLLNQIPRYFLMGGIAIGGLLFPLIYFIQTRFSKNILPTFFSIFYPSPFLIVTAFCLLIVALGNKFSKELSSESLFTRNSEVEEIFMYYFVFLYVLSLKLRIIGKG